MGETPVDSIVVVCTRNRPNELIGLLETLAKQTRTADVVLIIDASDDSELKLHAPPRGLPIVHCEATRVGLTYQRNQALEWCRSNHHRFSADALIHFLDDDVLLDPHYLEAMHFQLEQMQAAGGTGRQINFRDPLPPSKARKILSGDTQRPGSISRSGYNNGIPASLQRAIEVDWLPGCSMTFRWQSIRTLRFDERRVGYSLGEDVAFSLHVSSQERLVYVPSANLVHLQAPTNRDELPKQARDLSRHRILLAWGDERVSLFRATMMIQAEILRHALRALKSRELSEFGLAKEYGKGLILGLLKR